MSFIWPWVLVSLLGLPVCVYLYVRLQRKRDVAALSLGAMGVVRQGTAEPAGRRRHIPPAIFLAGIALLAAASARPQLTLPLPRMEGTVVLAVDVSSSMAADDVEPTRLDAAKLTAKTVVERRPDSARIGIVAFGEGGLVVQPPTDDKDALDATIDRLEPYSGTSLGQGVLTALNLIAPAGLGPDSPEPASATDAEPRSAFAPALIVLLTDGENTNPPDPLEVAQAAIDRGCACTRLDWGRWRGAR